MKNKLLLLVLVALAACGVGCAALTNYAAKAEAWSFKKTGLTMMDYLKIGTDAKAKAEDLQEQVKRAQSANQKSGKASVAVQ